MQVYPIELWMMQHL